MKNNGFVIITPCYNVDRWLPINIQLTAFQSYKNFLALYINDKSTDNTETLLKNASSDSENIVYINNENNGSQAKAYMAGIEYLESANMISDEDIIVEVDGDDWLSSVFVLEYLNQVYQNENIWMTYGQYQIYPTAQVGGHFDMRFVNENHRQNPFPYSHLKTYKYHLFNKINRQDLVDSETNEYYKGAWDHVLCLPMVEMAGIDRIYRCEDILYILNRHAELQNEGRSMVDIQKRTEQKIRKLTPYSRI